MDQKRDRAVGALVGLAVGDAIGTTVEFCRRNSFEPLTDMIGGGPFDLKPGQWTDDTSMALCLADSLIDAGGTVDRTDLLGRFSDWWRGGYNSVNGVCFDIGRATRLALENFLETGITKNNSHKSLQANGSIMRLSPAVICASTRTQALKNAHAQSLTTHAAPVPLECCAQLAGYLWDLIETGTCPGEIMELVTDSREIIVSSGHAPATLKAAKWSVAVTDSFADAVLTAANLGDDADTVAAVTGQIAGALYGYTSIPEDWLNRLAWHQHIVGRAEALWSIRNNPL